MAGGGSAARKMKERMTELEDTGEIPQIETSGTRPIPVVERHAEPLEPESDQAEISSTTVSEDVPEEKSAQPPDIEGHIAPSLPEPAPAGIPEEILAGQDDATPDLATVVAEMTALKHEVKLQARTFKKLQETLLAFTGGGEGEQGKPEWLSRLSWEVLTATGNGFRQGVQEAAEILDENRQAVGGELDEARDAGFLEAADALMDARDKLAFGIAEARRVLQGFAGLRGWLGGREVLSAALKGQELALSRLDDALQELELEPVAQVGLPFDPNVMRAVEASAATGIPGTILEVVRQGYMRAGEPLRTADVKVVAES